VAGRKFDGIHTAETIGVALGQIAKRLDAWKQQRAALATDIKALTEAARAMLSDLGHTDVPVASPVAPRRGGRVKGYVMSEETKLKLRAAWKRRKDAAAAAKPIDARASIRAKEGKKWTARQKGRG
jgi:hypothetical protein